jgi:nitroreductase
MTLDLTPDQLLTTTRSVRKRLDLTRPVEPELLRECLEIAVQAPTGGNSQTWSFVVVTDPAKRQALGDIYRRGYEVYRQLTAPVAARTLQDPNRGPQQQRVISSSDYLAEHFHEVPAMLIPCIRGRMDGKPALEQAGTWGSILPAVWNFMLAARARGLGTVWTTIHLFFEQDAAQVLGIPYEKVMQTALIPIAHTVGTDFAPAKREPLDKVVHWEQW